MSNKQTFKDGSSIEWEDKETLKYIEGDLTVFIWVDYEPGFFSRGRIIKSFSMSRGFSESFETNKKQEIIEKVKRYFKFRKISVSDTQEEST
jgi:hypothetical protein